MSDSVITMDGESASAASTTGAKSSQAFASVYGFCVTGLLLSIIILNSSAAAAQAMSMAGQTIWG